MRVTRLCFQAHLIGVSNSPNSQRQSSLLQPGDSDPNAKKRKVAEYIARLQITDIHLWEDSPNNIAAIETLADEIPGLTFTTELVTETVIRRFIREILREVLWK